MVTARMKFAGFFPKKDVHKEPKKTSASFVVATRLFTTHKILIQTSVSQNAAEQPLMWRLTKKANEKSPNLKTGPGSPLHV